jgi:hypothetical protein
MRDGPARSLLPELATIVQLPDIAARPARFCLRCVVMGTKGQLGDVIMLTWPLRDYD